MQLDRSKENVTKEDKLRPYLSTILMSNETEVMKWWAKQPEELKALLEDNKIPMELLVKARDQYFEERNDVWMLLEEILTIDLNPDHFYHNQAKAAVDQLLAE